jgi:hypothetical protein
MLNFFIIKGGKEMNQKFSYTFEFDAEINKLKGKLGSIQESFKELTGSSKGSGIEKTLGDIGKAISKLQEKASMPISSEATFGTMLKDSSAIGVKLKELNSLLD